MDFIDKIQNLSAKSKKQLENIHTEEATKTALVMPFIQALGYNVFDATEVIPEFIADHGVKKGEKVDYAICKNGDPIVLLECKCHGVGLSDGCHSQLYRYFSVTDAKFGILTNGIEYKFYTDSEANNKLDCKPFFEFDLLDYHDTQIDELKKFTKEIFDPLEAFNSAVELKYVKEIKQIVAKQLKEPEEDFVKFFVSKIYSGRKTREVINKFMPLVQKAMKQLISEKISSRFKTAIEMEENNIKHSQKSDEPETLPQSVVLNNKEGDTVSLSSKNFTGKKITGFIFEKDIIPIKSWSDLLGKTLELLVKKDNNNLDSLLTLHGLKRPYVTKNKDKLRTPEQIKGTNVYFEKNLSANNTCGVVKSALETVGLPEDSIQVILKYQEY